MNQPSERIECSRCHAMNPPDAESCWQCGQPLRAEDVSAVHEPSPCEREISGTSQVSQGSTPGRDTKVCIVLGWIFVVVGLVFCCYILPAVGIALGLVAYSKDDNRGLLIAIVGLIVLVLTSTAAIIFLATKTTPSVLLPGWI